MTSREFCPFAAGSRFPGVSMYGDSSPAVEACTDRPDVVPFASMFIDVVPNRESPPAILLRESWREGPKTCKRTIANLSRGPARKVALLRRLLWDEPLVGADELFTVERSLPHGHVDAILQTIRRLRLDTMLASKRCRERDILLGLIVERLIAHRWNRKTAAGARGI